MTTTELTAERGSRYRLARGHVKYRLIHELARGDRQRVDLAREYGVSKSSITEFARRHATQIAEVKADLQNEFAALWIAQKKARLAELQADVDQLGDCRVTVVVGKDPDGEPITVEKLDPALLRAKHAALRAAADELGQIPAKVNITMNPVTVRYEVVGVDPAVLQ